MVFLRHDCISRLTLTPSPSSCMYVRMVIIIIVSVCKRPNCYRNYNWLSLVFLHCRPLHKCMRTTDHYSRVWWGWVSGLVSSKGPPTDPPFFCKEILPGLLVRNNNILINSTFSSFSSSPLWRDYDHTLNAKSVRSIRA